MALAASKGGSLVFAEKILSEMFAF